MSVHVSSAVWKTKIDATEKLVLLKFADCASDDGGNAFPSVARVAAECGLGERTVKRAIKNLRDWGLLELEKPHNGFARRPATYRVAVERLKSANVAPIKSANPAPVKSANAARHRGQSGTCNIEEPSYNRHSVSKETAPKGIQGNASTESLAKQIFGPCVEYLKANDVRAERAKSLLGKWKSEYGAGAVVEAVAAAQRNGALEPVSYISRTLGNSSAKPSHHAVDVTQEGWEEQEAEAQKRRTEAIEELRRRTADG